MSATISNGRFLVTGGAGFIGSNLIEQLLAQGAVVCCLDNFSTGKRRNIAPFMNNKHFRLLEGDIRDAALCQEACDGMDYVFHEAALGSVPRSIEDPVTATEVNVAGFVNMLDAARRSKVRRFIYASSSAVYGDNPELPKREANIGKPLSPYGLTKWINELYAENFALLYNLSTVGLRYFNVFGRRQDPAGAYAAVIPRFTAMILAHTPPVINGDGAISRDFTHVDNVVAANLRAATADLGGTHTICNVACGESLTLKELFYLLRDALAEWDPAVRTLEPVFGPARFGDIQHSMADVGKASAELGFRSLCDAREGIRRAAEWYYRHPEALR